MFGTVVTMFIPAILFMYLEVKICCKLYFNKILQNRTFLDAIYFVVISLTTVGFGDITPSFKDSAFFIIYRFLVLCWIFFGLAYIGGLAPLVNELFNNYVYADIYLNLRHRLAEKVIIFKPNPIKNDKQWKTMWWAARQPKRVTDLVHQVHFTDLLSDFEDELNQYRKVSKFV